MAMGTLLLDPGVTVVSLPRRTLGGGPDRIHAVHDEYAIENVIG
jgi:hypothetical protein